MYSRISETTLFKSLLFGYTVHKILNVFFDIEQQLTDRDSFIYKRVDLSGFLLASLFRESFKQFQRDTKIAIDTEYRFNATQYVNEKFANLVNDENLRKIF